MQTFYEHYDFFPLTVLFAPLDSVRDGVEGIVRDWWGKMKISTGDVDLTKICQPPDFPRGSAHFTKILLWEPKENTGVTALFVNLQDAYNSLVSVWNSRFNKRSITVRLTNDGLDPHPHHEINVLSSKGEQRIVYTHFESGWKFFQSGTIQHFEDSLNYVRPIVKDRLTNSIVNDYLKKLDLDIASDKFYESSSDGVYLEQTAWKK